MRWMMIRTGSVLFLIGVLIFTIFISIPTWAGEYVIGPEDVLDIIVWGEEKLCKTVTVSEEGKFDYPLLGEIKASELTPKRLGELIKQELDRSYLQNSKVTVIVKEYNSQKVMVFGEVNKPGMYKLKGETTLLEFLAQVGGVSTGKGTVLILREEKNTVTTEDRKVKTIIEKVPIKTDLYDLLYKGDISCNIQVKAGDVLYVSAESGNRVYILGQVNEPGPYEIDENVTVMEAIKLAGGFTKIAAPNRIKIIREGKGSSENPENKKERSQKKKRRGDWRERYKEGTGMNRVDSRTYEERVEQKEEQGGQKEVIKVSVKKIMNGDSSQDVVLQAGDIIVVPETLL